MALSNDSRESPRRSGKLRKVHVQGAMFRDGRWNNGEELEVDVYVASDGIHVIKTSPQRSVLVWLSGGLSLLCMVGAYAVYQSRAELGAGVWVLLAVLIVGAVGIGVAYFLMDALAGLDIEQDRRSDAPSISRFIPSQEFENWAGCLSGDDVLIRSKSGDAQFRLARGSSGSHRDFVMRIPDALGWSKAPRTWRTLPRC